ncbi:MAG: hypothetical protein DMG21_06545 [Acidobacteria bacterium]|nr:MAG: hypothetical protein DMG21_06545 [Acidobacteriota bacterium]
MALVVGSSILSPFAGEPSGAALTSWTTPAVAVAGEAMEKATEFEATLWSVTEIEALPGDVIFELETVAKISVELLKAVTMPERGVPFHSTMEELVNPDPVTWIVNPPCPAIAYGQQSPVPLAGNTQAELTVMLGGGGGGPSAAPGPPPQPLRTHAPRTHTTRRQTVESKAWFPLFIEYRL